MADDKRAIEGRTLESVLLELIKRLEQTEKQLHKVDDALEEIVEALKSQEEVLDELRDVYRDMAYRDRGDY